MPDLDDRTFQDLVDDAKRLLQQRCPEWSDHNVSDPGVTLIEAVAQMVDQLVYRLNRVPDRHYLKFLELLGLELRPPAAARGEVTFWLSAAQPQPVLVRAETQVATPRTDVGEPVVFSTAEELAILPCSWARAGSAAAGQEPVDHTAALERSGGFECFSPVPQVGDALLVGLSNAVPSCAVVVRMDCEVRGVGVDPRRPPLQWEAWTPRGWVECEVERDGTGGFNRAGDVLLHVPREHAAPVLARQRAGWLRCRLVEARPDQPTYTASPLIRRLSAFTVGGTVRVVHAEAVRDEDLGTSDGTPGQRFPLQRRPVVSGAADVLHVTGGPGREDWTRVPHFAASGPDDRHFRIDPVAGEVQFGPAVREPDGALRHYGAVPPKAARLRLPRYLAGGGPSGNVARGQVRVLKTSLPYVTRVENRRAAGGGVAGESLADARMRAPVLLRTRDRAVTAEDFEHLAREIAPDAARVRCLPTDGTDPLGVRLVVVPYVDSDETGRVSLAALRPADPRLLQEITAHLDRRRLVGTRLLVQWAGYHAVTAVVDVAARPGHRPPEVRAAVLRALHGYLHPVDGGPDRSGWPLGQPLHARELVGVLGGVPGVDLGQQVTVQLLPADPGTGRRGDPVERLDLAPDELVLSYGHQVQVRS
ncbi:putative baseplate assembly protein [Geodermatophilus marinus]|uniref:putative baseplate assembly protein n=1 Tax=Geodermatophilus sp. LHW52908 TaxID=2303986 RepID=UPI0018F27CE8|nr:putative baseplate assembly protein [Geodermatophilus sp. LHW52908]